MQLQFDLRPQLETRVELPAGRCSWREGPIVVEVVTYPMCWNTGWSFWRPGFSVEAIGTLTRTRIA